MKCTDKKKIPEDSIIIIKDTEYKKELSKFIAKSFKAWNRHTEAERKNSLKHWNGMHKNDDFTPLQKIGFAISLNK